VTTGSSIPVAADRTVAVRCHELAPAVGELDSNLDLVTEAIRDAMAVGVQLLVLPELATSGYHLTAAEAQRCALPSTADIFNEWASLLHGDAVVVVGFCESADDGVFNSAAVITRAGIAAAYRKTHLWDIEKEVFRPGDEVPPLVETPIGCLGVLICYDLEFPELPRGLALAGADIIAVPTNWPLLPRPASERAPEVIQAMAAARSSGVVIACCDRAGPERGTIWTRGTTLVGTDGWPVGEKDSSGRLQAEVPILNARHMISPRNHLLNDRRPLLYR
jgi:predicted amidohydrolase